MQNVEGWIVGGRQLSLGVSSMVPVAGGGGPGPDTIVVILRAGGACPADTETPAGLGRFSGGSSFTQAFSSTLVHLPLVP